MKLLCISTSGPMASAALFEDGALTGERTGPRELTHSETVMLLAEELLSSCGLTPSDMDAFAADTGPGSFTGVRIGVCCVNAMGFALDKPVYGVCSLEAIACGLEDSVCALIDRRNRNVYAALYTDGREMIPPRADTLESFLGEVPADTLFVGDFSAFVEDIAKVVPGARFNDEMRLTAANVGRAALSYGSPAREIMPMYLVPSQAERLKKTDSSTPSRTQGLS